MPRALGDAMLDLRPSLRRSLEPELRIVVWLVRGLALGLVLGLMLSACGKKIGDGCSSSIDCSPNGDRLCDFTQPGGYCSIQGCDAETCPDGALCVEWRGEPSRTLETWCNSDCGRDQDCRTGYVCLVASSIVDERGAALARVLDEGREEQGICVPEEE